MKTIQLRLCVEVPDKTRPKAVTEMIDRLIDIGLDDAAETLRNGEGDLKPIHRLKKWEIKPAVVVEQRPAKSLFSAIHEHGHGTDAYIFRMDQATMDKLFNEERLEEVVAAALGIDYGGGRIIVHCGGSAVRKRTPCCLPAGDRRDRRRTRAERKSMKVQVLVTLDIDSDVEGRFIRAALCASAVQAVQIAFARSGG